MSERRCHGDGELPVNPGYRDPRTETSVRCPGCVDCSAEQREEARRFGDLEERAAQYARDEYRRDGRETDV